MDNPRIYGQRPFRVAVIHGGPGAGGEMAPVARQLAVNRGVLEPIQTKASLDGQVEELKTSLEAQADFPVTLIGYSWGAWLSYILAARHRDLGRRLILVSSGPFEEEYVAELEATRMGRLSAEEKTEFQSIVKALANAAAEDKDTQLARLGALASKTDSYDPILTESDGSDTVKASGDIFKGVWQEAAQMRKTGPLLKLAKRITCPVLAIHGNYDPHPAEGVRDPLSKILPDFRFTLLTKCGHTPWMERQAKDRFYGVLEEELSHVEERK
jgi:pimeloyl-ACP methyl ester carboxylesterase